jgi:hypothetical protein
LDDEEFSRPISVEMPKSPYAQFVEFVVRASERQQSEHHYYSIQRIPPAAGSRKVLLHELNIKRFVAIIVLTMSTHFFLINCVRRRFFIIAPACQMVVVVVECGGAMMSRVCCLLAWSIHKYGGMGQSVWLSSLAIQPENGKSCFF